MRLEKDVNSDEWRTPEQIKQLFSRLAASQKQVYEEDIVAEETEAALATIRNKLIE